MTSARVHRSLSDDEAENEENSPYFGAKVVSDAILPPPGYPRGVGVESVDGEGGGTGLPPVTAFDGMRCRLDEVGVVRECMGGVNEMFARYERARDEEVDEDDVAGAVTLEPEAEEAAEEEVR